MMELNSDIIYEVITKMVGPIQPVGETHTDMARLENLKVLIDVVDELLTDIDRVASNKNRIEYSMKLAGETASNFYDRIGIK